MYPTILVPVDLSPGGRRVGRHALDLARLMGSRVTLAHALTPGGNREAAIELLESLALSARRAPRLRLVEAGAAGIARAILDLANDEAADLIVIGARGEPSAPAELGSVAREVAARAVVPVQIVPRPNGPLATAGRWVSAARTAAGD